jgi:hypothetical protein
MNRFLGALALSAAFVLCPLTAAAAPGRVVCISGTNQKAGRDGVMQAIDQAAFLKRWPTDHAISITTQHILAKYARISVDTGTLQVVKLVHDGKETGTKPVWVIQASSDTDNLSDGAPEDLGAKLIGWRLADELNKSIASGATDEK